MSSFNLDVRLICKLNAFVCFSLNTFCTMVRIHWILTGENVCALIFLTLFVCFKGRLSPLPDQRDNILTFCPLTFDAIRIQLCTAFQDYEASIVLEIRNLWYVSVETATRLSMDQFFSNACSLHCTTA